MAIMHFLLLLKYLGQRIFFEVTFFRSFILGEPFFDELIASLTLQTDAIAIFSDCNPILITLLRVISMLVRVGVLWLFWRHENPHHVLSCFRDFFSLLVLKGVSKNGHEVNAHLLIPFDFWPK